ncbi:rRNA-processing protein fcf2-like [Pyrus communis]|uniref:rRNA-processing protein fcf2-like n=1 Tax=Pyrus communis TaxID=23211 RepID=UPI0035C12D66
MAETKAAIGLWWEPKLPAFSSTLKNGGGSGSKPRPEANPLWKPSTQLVDGIFVPPNDLVKRNKLAKKQIKDTAGTAGMSSAQFTKFPFSLGFDMPAPTMTPELQKDLQLLKLRNVMDPKRHYKKGDAQPNKYFQVGTVIESPLDFFSSRLTKKERKVSLAEEVLSDRNLGNYRQFMDDHGTVMPSGRPQWNSIRNLDKMF